MITFRGLFTEDPDRKFGAENYFTAQTCDDDGFRFAADCRDYYGESILRGFSNNSAMMFTKVYVNRADILVYCLKPVQCVNPTGCIWDWAGNWIYTTGVVVDWLDGVWIADPGKAEAAIPEMMEAVKVLPRIGGSVRVRVQRFE